MTRTHGRNEDAQLIVPGGTWLLLTADELLLLRQRLSDGPGTPAVDSALDAKLSRAQRQVTDA